jgi:hypothetical protein
MTHDVPPTPSPYEQLLVGSIAGGTATTTKTGNGNAYAHAYDSCKCRTIQPTPAQNKDDQRRTTKNGGRQRRTTTNKERRTMNDERRGEDRTTGRWGTGDRGYTAAPNDTTTCPSLTSLLVGWITDGTMTTPMPTHATVPYHPPPSLMCHPSAK